MTLPRNPAPRPDPQTGEPRPPQAPVEPDWKPYDKANDLVPGEPPAGKGPALEWFADTRGLLWGAAGFSFILLAAIATWKWGGLGWMKIWYVWLTIIACSGLFLLGRKNMKMTAGADWFSVAGSWIDTYQLRNIKITESTSLGVNIVLIDQAEHKIDTKLYYLQKNRKLWDLVYNGILHSIMYNGAAVNRRAADHLELGAVMLHRPIDD